MAIAKSHSSTPHPLKLNTNFIATVLIYYLHAVVRGFRIHQWERRGFLNYCQHIVYAVANYYKHRAGISVKHELAFRIRHCTRDELTIRTSHKHRHHPSPLPNPVNATVTDYTGNTNLICHRH